MYGHMAQSGVHRVYGMMLRTIAIPIYVLSITVLCDTLCPVEVQQAKGDLTTLTHSSPPGRELAGVLLHASKVDLSPGVYIIWSVVALRLTCLLVRPRLLSGSAVDCSSPLVACSEDESHCYS